MAGEVYVGTSGWSYPDWAGVVHPKPGRGFDPLAFMAEYFDALEINSSFYHLPRESVIGSWVERTPANFTFVLKGSRAVTHLKKLRDCGESVDLFYERASGLGAKLKAGLPAMAMVFTKFSDQKSTVEDGGDHYIYTIHQCPVCWGRTADRPICFAAKGLLEEGLHWVSGGSKFRIEEVECVAMGGETCTFAIYKEPLE